MLTHGLIQVVSEPTDVQESSYSILDLVLLNHAFSKNIMSIEDGLSDYYLVAVSLPIAKTTAVKTAKTTSFEDYSRANDALEHGILFYGLHR